MRIIAALVLLLCLALPGFAVQASKHPSSHGAKTTAAASKKKKGRKRVAVKPKSTAQKAPTPDRYQEIQQALLAKGYAPHQPNGVWDPDWASSLKRFQQDQKLEPTGKLNSLSLITLGLGPKREPPAGATAPPAPPATEPSSSSSTVREPK